MLNRRHIRVKVMQSIYAMHQHQSDNLDKEEKFLFQSIENTQNLYLLLLSALIEIKKKESEYIDLASKKHLATKEESNPNLKFINNKILVLLAESEALETALEDHKINNWKMNDDIILSLIDVVKENNLFKKYMNESVSSFEADKNFIIDLYTDVIAPSDRLYEYLEDYKLTWVDDLPGINTLIVKQIKQLKSEQDTLVIPKVYKDSDDKEFVKNLFRKTVLNETELSKQYIDKTPNWDVERIAELDTIILKTDLLILNCN